MLFKQAGPGDQIYSKLESSGTTAPVNTVLLANPEQGLATFRIADGTTAGTNTVGGTKAVAAISAATAGFYGIDVLQPDGTDAPIIAVVGLLAKAIGAVSSGVAAAEVEFGQVQCYGYFDDALLDAAVAAGVDLVGESGTNDLITATVEAPDSGTGTVNCYADLQRTVAEALEADAAGIGDVFLFCM